MYGIYNYIPETNRVYTLHSVAPLLYLQSVLHVLLFCSCNMFCTFTSALLAVCVRCTIWLFFLSSLISCFPSTLLRYCLNHFEMVPVTCVFTGITFAFTFHMCWISIVMYSYIRIFLPSFLFTFLCALIATSINIHIHCSLSRIVLSSLLLW